MTLLLVEHRFHIHKDGAIDSTFRQVYRVDHASAVEDWAGFEAAYQPWRQFPPEIRARVITADGVAHDLDPKTIAQEPLHESDSAIYSDTRNLRVPLPAVAPGAIVEYQAVVRDRFALSDAGVVRRVVVPEHSALENFHAIIDAEPGVELRFASRLIPDAAIHRTTDAQGTHIECNLGPRPARTEHEYGLPPDVPASPYFAFSTGHSWQSVAAKYGAIVNERIAGADVSGLLEGVDLQGPTELVVSRLAARLHRAVRYTGVEFGENATIPNRPAEVLRRGYGDCKDKSALLVAMLRAAGLHADVALLDSGYGLDLDKELPGLGRFDHVIVRVDAAKPVWIDATSTFTRIGYLPPADQGRLALVANAATTALVKTPEATSADVWQRQTFDVHLSGYGNARIFETIETSGGSREADMREKNGGVALQSRDGGGAPAETSGPLCITRDASHAGVAVTGLWDATVHVDPWRLFEELPHALKVAAKRKDDFLLTEPYRAEYRYRIFAPPMFQVSNPPPDETVHLGPVTYSRRFVTDANGVFEAVYSLDTGPRRMTAEGFNAFAEAFRRYNRKDGELLTLTSKGGELAALGEYGKAIDSFRTILGALPGDATLRARFARVLRQAGRLDEARTEARRALDLDERSAFVWESFASVTEGADAEKALRRAMDLDPDDPAPPMELAMLVEQDPLRRDEAIALYRDAGGTAIQNLVMLLVRSGRLDEARDELRKANIEDGELSAMVTAMQEGPARVVIEAQSRYLDARRRSDFLRAVAGELDEVGATTAAGVLRRAEAR